MGDGQKNEFVPRNGGLVGRFGPHAHDTRPDQTVPPPIPTLPDDKDGLLTRFGTDHEHIVKRITKVEQLPDLSNDPGDPKNQDHQ